jgi:hypothetical protein
VALYLNWINETKIINKEFGQMSKRLYVVIFNNIERIIPNKISKQRIQIRRQAGGYYYKYQDALSY